MFFLRIGQIVIRINGINKDYCPYNILKFECSYPQCIDITYNFYIDGTCNNIDYPVIYQTKDIVVLKKGINNEVRVLRLPNSNIPYAMNEELGDNKINVYVNPSFINYLKNETLFMSLLGLEKQEFLKGGYILHCAYLKYDNKAILFCGPSGIGKTTHSTLWEKVYPNNVKIINGDKCLINIENDSLLAYGWPVCGSSNICFNINSEVACIVFLMQGENNRIIKEKNISYFKRMIEQTTINTWNKDFTSHAITFIERIIQKNKCCTYSCDISTDAVNVLFNYLRGLKWI